VEASVVADNHVSNDLPDEQEVLNVLQQQVNTSLLDSDGSDLASIDDNIIPELRVDGASIFRRHVCQIVAARSMSIMGVSELLSYFFNHRPEDMTRWPRYENVRRGVLSEFPSPRIDIAYRDLSVGTEVIVMVGLSSYPKKRLDQVEQLQLVYERTYMPIATIRQVAIREHANCADGRAPNFDVIRLGIDGVPESKSGAIATTMEIVCLQFEGCRGVHPVQVLKKYDRSFKMTSADVVGPIIAEIKQLHLNLSFVVADAPERAFLRCQNTFAGYYSCDLCTQRGDKLTRKRTGRPTKENPENQHTGIYFPVMKTSATLRKDIVMRQIMSDLESNRENGEDHTAGYYGTSPFVALESFDLVHDLVVDHMHNADLGVTRKLFKLSTSTTRLPPTARRTRAVRLTAVLPMLRDLLSRQQVPVSFARRVRSDFAHYKAHEWRTMATLFFPILVEGFQSIHATEIAELWLLHAFILRAHILNNAELMILEQNLNGRKLSSLGREFLKLFQKVFTEKKISYNVHVYGEHITTIRKRRPLPDCWAYGFESAYGCVIKSFHPGTLSLGKQAFGNLQLATSSTNHSCVKTVNFEPKGTKSKRSNDNLVVAKDGTFYSITAIPRNPEKCFARKLLISKYQPLTSRHVPCMDLVDVHTYLGEATDDPIELRYIDIKTKAVMAIGTSCKVILSIPIEQLTLM
jgi:hypothetical protein